MKILMTHTCIILCGSQALLIYHIFTLILIYLKRLSFHSLHSPVNSLFRTYIFTIRLSILQTMPFRLNSQVSSAPSCLFTDRSRNIFVCWAVVELHLHSWKSFVSISFLKSLSDKGCQDFFQQDFFALHIFCIIFCFSCINHVMFCSSHVSCLEIDTFTQIKMIQRDLSSFVTKMTRRMFRVVEGRLCVLVSISV